MRLGVGIWYVISGARVRARDLGLGLVLTNLSFRVIKGQNGTHYLVPSAIQNLEFVKL